MKCSVIWRGWCSSGHAHTARCRLLWLCGCVFSVGPRRTFSQWGGRRSRSKFEHIVEDLRNNCHEQWKEAHDLHIDTLDVYLIEVGALPRAQEHGV